MPDKGDAAKEAEAAKEGWSMQFDMSGGMTPRTRAHVEGGKKKVELEKAKHELKTKAARSMMKLCDRDTQQTGIAEMQKICEELKKPELCPIIVNVMCEFDGGKSAFARAQGARMFGMFSKYHPAAVQQSMGKVISALCKRSRDADSNVREACAETIGELARLACSEAGESKVDDTTAELDASTLQDGPSLGAFFRPILQAMESADSHHQQGCALALAHVVFNAGPKIHPHLEKLTKRILPILDNSHFNGRPQLLIAIANIVEVCPEGFQPLLPSHMPRIKNACSHSEWNTRKAAMEMIETMATRLQPASLLEHKDEILDLLEKCKYDKMKPVREAAAQAMQAALGVEGFVKQAPSQEEGGAEEEEEVGDENAEPDFSILSASLSNNNNASQQPQHSASPAQRTPMQALRATNKAAPKTGGGEPEGAALKGLSDSQQTSLSGGWGHQSQAGGEQLPSKEAWGQLLRHFERMTLQQTQLIEMVSGFSESARERLETVEQKVFAIELRLSAMENRQSLPGMPPTPSRAHIQTPSRGGGGLHQPQPAHGTPSRPVPALQLPVFPENASP